MSDFLAAALSQAKADLALKRSAGPSYGKAKSLEQPAKKKPKWLDDKSRTVHSKKNNVHAKDSTALSDYDLERSRKALERKEKQYRKMFNRGTDMTLDEQAADNLLIDFDRKWAEGHRQDESDDDDDNDEDDPLIEVEDEFGRLRTIRQSQALRHEKPEVRTPSRPKNLIYGRHLQTFNPDARKKDEIWAEEEAAREVHYDPAFEVRQRGAGYINLGRGQDRKDRMEDLSQSRQETVNTRLGHGLTEVETPSPFEIAPDNETQNKDDRDYIHPSRRSQLPQDTKSHNTMADEVRKAERIKAGEAFLNSIT